MIFYPALFDFTATLIVLMSVSETLSFHLFFPCAIVNIVYFLLGVYRVKLEHFNFKFVALIVSVSFFTTFAYSIFLLEVTFQKALLNSYILTTAVVSWRFLVRTLLLKNKTDNRIREPVIIYGAGVAGIQTALGLSKSNDYRPVAFIDDSVEIQGSIIAGIVVYPRQQLPEIIEKTKAKEVILAMPSATRVQKERISYFIAQSKIRLRTLPGLTELVGGKVDVNKIRDLKIEDLLGREPVPAIDQILRSSIDGKSVLVTGAGGSIGSEISLQILSLNPKRVVFLDSSELALYKLEQKISRIRNNFDIKFVLASVTSRDGLKHLFEDNRFDSVYHAAAYKHVPILEENWISAIENNVLGTKIVAELSAEFSVGLFLLVSTDKAVRPTNIMGATKRISEIILQMMAKLYPKTIFTMVRFGNVLGSSGSVIPLFQDQIKRGGPLTVTHPEVTRYFMTIPEAASLVLQAGGMAKSGELYMLDMGAPIKIIDLARKMLMLSGFSERNSCNPSGDIEIIYTGLRPGEKLFEELLISSEASPTEHPSIFVAKEPDPDDQVFFEAINFFESGLKSSDKVAVFSYISRLVEGFCHKYSSLHKGRTKNL